MIAAIKSKGKTIVTKTPKELLRFSLIKFSLFFLRKKDPNFTPIPKEMKTAGNSNIPWGTNLQRIDAPCWDVVN